MEMDNLKTTFSICSLGVFGGKCCESVGASGSTSRSECIMSGVRRIVFEFSGIVDGIYLCSHSPLWVDVPRYY